MYLRLLLTKKLIQQPMLLLKAHLANNTLETCEYFKQMPARFLKNQIKYLETVLFVDSHKFENKCNKSAILAKPAF